MESPFTSEDGSYPACELNAHGPAARGWRSAGAAPPPHELLLRLGSVAAIHKLQLLAHHQLVPSSVEVLVSGGVAGAEGAATPCGATYVSVGKVVLAKPQPQARTRELRSAALPEPTVARFVKLRLSGPHAPTSEDEQVALMAVNVLGEEIEDPPAPEQPNSPKPTEASYSPYDDLAFVMYVDMDIAEIIRKLDARKKDAITEERFEYARRLKSAGASLAGAGLRIGRWRLRKRLAAARDDFELARHMRDKISEAMTAIGEDLELCRLMEDEGPDPLNDRSMLEEYDFSHHLSPNTMPGALSFDIPSPQPPVDVVTGQMRGDMQQIRETHHTREEPDHTKLDLHMRDETHSRDGSPKTRVETHIKENHHQVKQEPHLVYGDTNKQRVEKVELANETTIQDRGRPNDVCKTRDVRKVADGVDLVEANSPLPTAHGPAPAAATVPERVDPARRLDEEEAKKGTDSPRRSITPNAANGTLVRRRNKSAGPRSTFEAYEERMLPALRHSHTNEYLRECGRAGAGGEEEAGSAAGSAGSHARPPAPHKLNERERKQAALPILIFGYQLVEKFYSKTYLDKEEGLARLRSELTAPEVGSSKTSPNKTARAAATLLQRLLRDKVFSVYSQANEIVRVLFQDFMPGRVCAAEVGRCLERLLPELLRAAGDPAPRVHSTAQHTVLTIADCSHVRSLHLIPQQLVRPVPASTHPRMALSRLQMLEQLVDTHGISTDKNSGLTVRRLAECGAAGAQHAAGAVRAAAERILLAAYNRSPRVVRAQLPPDDAVTRRNLIYRHLFQQFDRIDMQKMLNKAPSEDQLPNGASQHDSIDCSLDAVSVIQSTHSGVTSTLSGLTSLGMTSSLGGIGSSLASSMRSSHGMTSSLGGMTSSVSGSTLAPSSLSSRTKSSLKKTPTKRYSPSMRPARDFSNYPGYNKLRLDSAVSPKHVPKSAGHAFMEKVHFEVKHNDEVIYRRAHRNPENRHSMIHYDHENSKPDLKERPMSVYDPMLPEYSRDSPSMHSPKMSKHELRSLDSFSMDSPKMSRTDLRSLESLDTKQPPDYYKAGGCDSPKISLIDKSLDRQEYFREAALDSPNMVAGLRSLHLDECSQMDESGYYSPGDTRTGKQMAILRSKSGTNVAEYCDQHFDSFEGGGTTGDISSGGNTPEPLYSTQCTWCGRTVRAGGLDAHYWRRCVLLSRCQHCHQVLEARVLHAHLLDECSMSGDTWTQCGKCGAALRGDEGSYHAHCQPSGAEEWKCPYCLSNILARDEPWQRHLMQCPRNPRVMSGGA